MFLLASSFAAVGQEGGASPEGGKKAQITFEKKVHNFGKIPFNGDASYTFTFTNTGNQPLIMYEVISTCGCTKPTWSDKPYRPGEEGTIMVSYITDDPDNVGSFTKWIFVHSNATEQAVKLKINGTLLEKKD